MTGQARPAPQRSAPGDQGFSLIEALVALALLAIAAVTYIGAAQAHLGRIGGLEQRVAARWVAENLLAEWSAVGGPPPQGPVAVRLLDQDWVAQAVLVPTDDPDLARVEIAVSVAGGAAPAVRLGGFLDLGAVR